MLRLRAIDAPAHIGIASCLLGHRTGSTAERYYNQARSIEASRLMQDALLARRNYVLGADDPTRSAPLPSRPRRGDRAARSARRARSTAPPAAAAGSPTLLPP